MDWFLYDNGFRHERVKISDIDKVIFQTSNYAYNMIHRGRNKKKYWIGRCSQDILKTSN